MPRSSVPEIRIARVNRAEIAPAGDYVLYWMITARRTSWNFGLDQAVARARELEKPLVVFEALRCGYRWASDRLHRFALQGMQAQRAAWADAPLIYYPYVEPRLDAARGLLAALAERACLVVTDEFPCFFLPAMVAHVGRQLPVRLEQVDSNGMLPLRAADRVFPTAYAFRRFLQQNLAPHLEQMPQADPLAGLSVTPAASLLDDVRERWPAASDELLTATREALSELPIDHTVGAAAIDGGEEVARKRLERFLSAKLERYAEDRNVPDLDASSGFSPYLHWGHLSVHEVFHDLARREGWKPSKLAKKASGSREGWWGMSPTAESFLDELITWREVGYNFCSRRRDYAEYESLPEWAQETLAEHRRDHRPSLYTLEQFERSQTHDPLWNAAQRQLVREGRLHNYLRMLWGKKILEWSPTPQSALATMIELNNKYAVDGRNPNSYSGIFWVLGRYDRPWGPERPIYGKIRYMTSENTARKVAVKEYLRRHGPAKTRGLWEDD